MTVSTAVARAVAAVAGASVRECVSVPGGDICQAWRARLDDGRDVFAKTRSDAPGGFFTAEAAGLAWLADAGTVPIPEVVGASDDVLVLSWVPSGPPSRRAAAQFGAALAGLHRAGADSFGAPWPAFVGSAPLDNSPAGSWAEFYAARRLLPLLRRLRDSGRLDAGQADVIEQVVARLGGLAGPPEPPARLHGDLWNGNILWSAAGPAFAIDASAHGGHRETDLAMLSLFGAPYFDTIMGAYEDTFPLSDGWADRVALHQLHPLLVHALLFGGGYVSQALTAAGHYR